MLLVNATVNATHIYFLSLFSFQNVLEGMGQLEAYINAQEGVAFQMDNYLIWDSLGKSNEWAIQGVPEKKKTSKFWITRLHSEKVMMSDWTDMYLAPVPAESDPNAYPLQPFPNQLDTSVQFEVFYRGNKVAFRAYNGLFLTRVHRDFHTIEAANPVDDDSYCFRPMIGDIDVPTFKIQKVIASDLPELHGYRCVLKKERIYNWNNTSKSHTFCLKWETTVKDRVAWKHQWGLGIPNSHRIKIRGMTVNLKYTEDNDNIVYVKRKIYEKHEKHVVIPPDSVCTARLLAMIYDNAVFKFTAKIRKVKPNGGAMTLVQPVVWTGLIYQDIYVAIEIQ